MIHHYFSQSWHKIALFFVFVLIASPLSVSAISGACSYHDGVNCAAGASLSGYAICNDGWESSTFYSDTDECKQVYCPSPIASGCTTQNDVNGVSVRNVLNGLAGSSFAAASDETCRSQVNAYQAEVAIYNACVLSSTGLSSAGQYKEPMRVVDISRPRVPQPPSPDSLCQADHDVHSKSVKYQDQDYCGCNDGYTFDANKQCIWMTVSYCKDTYGDHIHQATASCECDAGYIARGGGKCVPENTATETPAQLPQEVIPSLPKRLVPKPAESSKVHDLNTLKINRPENALATSTSGNGPAQTFSTSTNASSSSNSLDEQVKEKTQEPQTQPIRAESSIKKIVTKVWMWFRNLF